MTRCNECGHSDCCGPLRENDVEALQARIAELEGALAEVARQRHQYAILRQELPPTTAALAALLQGEKG